MSLKIYIYIYIKLKQTNYAGMCFPNLSLVFRFIVFLLEYFLFCSVEILKLEYPEQNSNILYHQKEKQKQNKTKTFVLHITLQKM